MARRRERAQHDRRLEKLAIEVLTALGERDAAIAATEQRADAALQAMVADESLTVSEAVHWCVGAVTCVRVVHDAEDPSALPSGWGLLAG